MESTLKQNALFQCFDEVSEAILQYEKESFTKFVIRYSKTVQGRNKQIMASKNTKKKLLKDKLKYSHILYSCVHGKDRACMGKGIRPNQRTTKLDCPAKVVLTATADGLNLEVTEFIEQHNHDTSEGIYSRYPAVRRLNKTEKNLAKTLLAENVEANKVKSYISELSGKSLTTRDILNLKIPNEKKTEEEKLMEVLESVLKDDPNSTVLIQTDSTGDLQVIFVQTGQMKEYLRKFPEVLILDTTYRVNNRHFELASVMTVDGEQHGHVVCHAFVANDDAANWTFVLKTLQEHNKSTDQTQLFLIDKDFAEKRAILDTFPNSNINYCLFHVKRAFKRNLKGTDEEVNALNAFLDRMCYSETKQKYQEAYDDMQEMTGCAAFKKYFETNWNSQQNHWAGYARCQTTTYGIRTTNHLESYHSMLKQELHAGLSLSASVKLALQVLKKKGLGITHREFLEKVTRKKKNRKPVDHCEFLCNEATGHACEIMRTESRQAVKSHDKDAGKYETKCATNEVSCTCPKYRTTHLPCRHVFYVAATLKIQPSLSWIPVRFRKAHQAVDLKIDEDAVEQSIMLKRCVDQPKRTRGQKFREVQKKLQNMCYKLIDLPSKEFQQYASMLDHMQLALEKRLLFTFTTGRVSNVTDHNYDGVNLASVIDFEVFNKKLGQQEAIKDDGKENEKLHIDDSVKLAENTDLTKQDTYESDEHESHEEDLTTALDCEVIVEETIENTIDLTTETPMEYPLSKEIHAEVSDKEEDEIANSQSFKIRQKPFSLKGRPRTAKRKAAFSISAAAKKKNTSGNQTEKSVKNITVTDYDLATLNDDAWLNDKVIDAYLALRTWEVNGVNKKRVFAMSSHVATSWMEKDYTKWTYEKVDLLKYDLILMPVCVSSHWTLVVANCRTSTVYRVDSLKNITCDDFLEHWKNFMKSRNDVWQKWTHENLPCSVQDDGVNCGIFVFMVRNKMIF